MTHGPHDGEPFGRYRLQRALGRGGMGEVWVAWDTHKECDVALKRLRHEYAEDADFQVRFRREAQLAARLRDPHVIPIHDFGEIDGHLYIEMRLVDGVDLEQTLRAGALTPEQVVSILAQVAMALDSAHETGLVHRDVKPSNIVLTGRPERYFAYLVDFGIARPLVGHGGSKVTATVGTVGTLTYLAPERIEGEPGDRRADVYSLACVLYECLTRQAPYAGEQFAVMYAHVNKPAPKVTDRLPHLPPAIDDVIARGMAKSPDDRYDSAGDLAEAARQALSSAPAAGADPPVPSTGPTTLLPSSSFTPPPASFTPPPFMPLPVEAGPPAEDETPAIEDESVTGEPVVASHARAGRLDVRATVVAAVGAIAVLLAFVKLSWFRRGDAALDEYALSGTDSEFSKLPSALDALQQRVDESGDPKLVDGVGFGISPVYFGWLAWLLFALTALVVAALLYRPDRRLRVAAAVLAALALVATLLAVRLYTLDQYASDYTGHPPPTYFRSVKQAAFGFWAAVVGFVLLGLASILRRRREDPAPADIT